MNHENTNLFGSVIWHAWERMRTHVICGSCARYGRRRRSEWRRTRGYSFRIRLAQVWTQDGLLLDRISIIPAVPEGESIFVSRDKSIALPTFKSDMLPNELEEFVESSFVKFFGEGDAVVNTSGLRPHRFGEHRGVLFDFEASLTDSPDYRGMVGAFIANDLLYVISYSAAEPYYYGKHVDEAKMIIETASL